MSGNTITVVGLGTMGCGIALSALTHGYTVRVVDADQERTQRGAEEVRRRLTRHIASGLLAPEASRDLDVLQAAEDIDVACGDTTLVIEAVPEIWTVKRDVLNCVSQATGGIIATNTSSFPIDELATSVDHPQRFLGVHFFNPAEWIPGVELIPCQATTQSTVESVRQILNLWGKSPAVVRSSPGFVANRLQLALFLECLRCVEEGLASVEDIDNVVRSTFGFRLGAFGPFAIADMAGLDVYESILGTLSDGYGERFATPARLHSLVSSGALGIKTGRGFLDYDRFNAENLLSARDLRYAQLAEVLAGQPHT